MREESVSAHGSMPKGTNSVYSDSGRDPNEEESDSEVKSLTSLLAASDEEEEDNSNYDQEFAEEPVTKDANVYNSHKHHALTKL